MNAINLQRNICWYQDAWPWCLCLLLVILVVSFSSYVLALTSVAWPYQGALEPHLFWPRHESWLIENRPFCDRLLEMFSSLTHFCVFWHVCMLLHVLLSSCCDHKLTSLSACIIIALDVYIHIYKYNVSVCHISICILLL